MSGTSTKTTVISLRIPNDVVEAIDRRIQKSTMFQTRSDYLVNRIVYDIRRKHGK